jgi:hypothetical protein
MQVLGFRLFIINKCSLKNNNPVICIAEGYFQRNRDKKHILCQLSLEIVNINERAVLWHKRPKQNR